VADADALAYDLHVLVARLDASADAILRATSGVTYRRFLALLAVRDLGPTSQRAVADRLGITEPSVSRMTAVLAGSDLLQVSPHPSGGNRRQLSLTDRGRGVVDSCASLLESRFAALVGASGIDYAEYAAHTRRLVTALDRGASEGAA
jgi:DNA-binding MarR family transcriptional regulator